MNPSDESATVAGRIIRQVIGGPLLPLTLDRRLSFYLEIFPLSSGLSGDAETLGDRRGVGVAGTLRPLVRGVANTLRLGDRLRTERGVERRRATDRREHVGEIERQRIARMGNVNLLHLKFLLRYAPE